MGVLFSHATRWEWAQHNPIAKVRQSAKRLHTPDVLTPAAITTLLAPLQEPPRTAAEIDAFKGLSRGELIGLQWQDVNFDAQVIHVRGHDGPGLAKNGGVCKKMFRWIRILPILC